jgi:hypothetical protein
MLFYLRALVAGAVVLPLTSGFSNPSIYKLSALHLHRRSKNGVVHNPGLMMSSVSVTPPIDEEVKDTIFEPLGVGIKRDFGRRLPFYKSDITDGLNARKV